MSDSAPGFEDYDGLVAAVADWVARPDLLSKIPMWIRLIESEIQRDLNLREQDQVKTGTLSLTDDFIEFPDDYLYGKMLRLDTDPLRTFNMVSTDKWVDVTQNRTGDSTPSAVTTHGNRLYFAPAPGADDPYTLWYTGRIKPLSKENQTNRLLTDAPDALLYGALKHGAPYIGSDERFLLWAGLAEAAKESYKAVNWKARIGSGAPRVRPDVSVNDQHHAGRSYS